MRRGTTPTITLTVSNEDGSSCDLTEDEIYVTFVESGADGVTITKTNKDPGVTVEVVEDATVVSVKLSQEETLRFRPRRRVKVQLRSKHGTATQATGIAKFKVDEILMDGEI